MNDTNTNKKFSPHKAIIVYKDHSKYSPGYYLEDREIKNIGGKFVFMAPVPLAANVMKDIARSYVKNNYAEVNFSDLIGEHLLHASNKAGKTVVMWYRPAMLRKLNFSSSLKIKGESNVLIPAILYLVVNNNLYLWALMTDERPNLKTKIYNAPFFNIYEDGRVCLGTAKVGVKSSTYEGEAERFERAFYLAEQNGGQSRFSCKTPLEKLWTSLIKSKSPFPSKKELIQHKKYKTVGEAMNKIIGNNLNDDDDE